MAFTVTPTSGAEPYTFNAQFSDAVNIDNVHFSLTIRSSQLVGSCPPIGNGTDRQSAVNALLATGEYVDNEAVPAGSCRAYTAQIINKVTGDPISSETVTVSNV